MAYAVSDKQRTQLTVERSAKGNALETISSLTQLPPAIAWKAGVAVASAKPGQISPGTLIATFDGNGVPVSSFGGGQVAVYLGHDQGSIRALAPDPYSPQGRWQPTQISLFQPDAVVPKLNGHAYRVIE